MALSYSSSTRNFSIVERKVSTMEYFDTGFSNKVTAKRYIKKKCFDCLILYL